MSVQISGKYKIIDHTADIGITVTGKNMEEVFINAARGMFSLITDLRRVRIALNREVQVNADNREELLVAWLNELIYIFDVEHLLFRKFDILTLSDTNICAKAYGEKVDTNRHTIKRGIKATTYHILEIAQNEDGYRARVLFDI